jgi:hypothetical protein
MNRLKKELRKRGVKLEDDYPELPCGELQAIFILPEKAEAIYCFTSDVLAAKLTREGELAWV